MKTQFLCFLGVLLFLPIQVVLGQSKVFSRQMDERIPFVAIENARCDTLAPFMQGAFLPAGTTLDEARKSNNFVPLKTLHCSSYGSHSCWMRFAVHNPGDKRVTKWMVFAQTGIEYFRLYQLFGGTVDSCEGGLGRDRQKSCSNSFFNSVKLDLAPGDTLVCYLFLYERVNYYSTKLVHLFDEKAFYKFHAKLDRQLDYEKVSLSITCSLIFFTACFFVLQSLLGWNTTYLPYSFYLIALTLFFLRHLEGLFDRPFLFGHFHWLLIGTPMPWVGLIMVTYLKFAIDFFGLRDNYPVHARMFSILIWIYIIEMVICTLLDVYFFDERYSKVFFGNSQVLGSLFQLYGILILFKKPGLPYRLVATGSVILATTTGYSLFVPYEVRRAILGSSFLLIQIGAIIEVLLFSAAFGLKMRQIDKERRAYERIRENISSDLHDEIGSTLSSISILSEAVQKNITTEEAAHPLSTISERTRQVMDTMSDIVWSVNPMNDQMDRILLHMQEYLSEVLEAKGIEHIFETNKALEKQILPMELRKDLYLLFKEAINNVAKYSAATQVLIKLNKFDQEIYLEIKDNGWGFDVEKVKQGNGLKNMATRAERMGGKLWIESIVGQGTLIKLNIPLV